MDKYIRDILGENPKENKDEKYNKILKIFRDADFALKVLNGKYAYCKECDNYYLVPSYNTLDIQPTIVNVKEQWALDPLSHKPYSYHRYEIINKI